MNTKERATTRASRRRGRDPWRFRPLVMALEGRALLSTVTSLLDDGPGTLRAAIRDATPGDRIDFAPELAGGTIALSSTLVLTRSVEIDGPDGAPMVLDGGNARRVMRVEPGVTATLLDLTITRGYLISGSGTPAQRGGAGIDNAGNSLTLRRCSVTNNTINLYATGVAAGGGIYNDTNLVLDTCVVTGNTAMFYGQTNQVTGGGIENQGGSVTMIGGSVSNNTVDVSISPTDARFTMTIGGGGIHSTGGSLTLSGVTIAGNVVKGRVEGGSHTLLGGGIANQGGSVSLVDSVVRANQITANSNYSWLLGPLGYSPPVSLGGGIYSAGTLDVRTSQIAANVARGQDRDEVEYDSAYAGGGSGFGGGIYVAGGEARLLAATIQGNQALGGHGARGINGYERGGGRSGWSGDGGGPASGGGVYVAGGRCQIVNSAVVDNTVRGGYGGSGGSGTVRNGQGGSGGSGGWGGNATGGGLAGQPAYVSEVTISGNQVIAGPGGSAGTGAGGGLDGSPGSPGRVYPDTTPLAALSVAPVVVNGGMAQRSNVATASFQFNLPTSLGAKVADGSIASIVTLYGPDGRVTLPASRYRYDEATKVLTIDLAGPDGRTMLADGRYQLRIATAQVAAAGDPNNTLIDTDATFDGLTVSSFHRLQGDYDGDGTVAVADRVDLMAHFGAAPGTALYYVAYDLNGDGVVNLADYLIWTRRLGRRV